MIALHNLTVAYRRRPVVHHVNATFGDGQMWAIFGPNGAGKSTLLKSIMGLVPSDGGHVDLGCIKRRNIAYLPQQAEIDRSQPLSVAELAATGLWHEMGFFGGLKRSHKERVEAALEQVGMADFAKRAIGQLSNGQFQRVLFARMLVQDARILLLDEPFNAVDAATIAALLEALRQFHAEKFCTVVAVLHDVRQVEDYFEHTLLLAKKVIAAGKTSEVLTLANREKAANIMTLPADDRACPL